MFLFLHLILKYGLISVWDLKDVLLKKHGIVPLGCGFLIVFGFFLKVNVLCVAHYVENYIASLFSLTLLPPP